MKVLFVFRSYGPNKTNSVVDFQRDSLKKYGIEIENFQISSGGIKGYLKALFRIRKVLKNGDFNLIHAHYSYCGFITWIFSKVPVICSLMGSDIYRQNQCVSILTKLFSKYLWTTTIVKSEKMQECIPKSSLIPNGVDMENFRIINKPVACEKVGYSEQQKNIIFIATSPEKPVKNLELAYKSIKLLNNNKVKLHIISDKSFNELPYFYNAASLLLLTSLSEGSPNIVKEAMACNCPIVSVDVGDVKETIGNTQGCYICSYYPEDVAEKIRLALNFADEKGRTNGRLRIMNMNLDEEKIAKKIIDIYYKSLKQTSTN